jgi:Zn ribbon nucleic-acid-binding protein
MTLRESAVEIRANLEYPACPLCESDQREFSFHLHEPYRVARCVECGFHYLYPRLIESAMQEVYRESSYYEGGACGYELHASGVRIVSNIKHLPHSVARRGLTLSRSLRIELSRDMLN